MYGTQFFSEYVALHVHYPLPCHLTLQQPTTTNAQNGHSKFLHDRNGNSDIVGPVGPRPEFNCNAFWN